jgi:non-specific serine/threonine protein kinase/serine/threonine-protein kinase
MAPESASFWETVEALFADAMAIPASERASFLDTRCGSDERLRTEVESLIDAEGGSEGFLAVDMRSAETPDTGARDDVGLVIGPFRLTERIGEGGMGLVYRAERIDDFSQRVAIKLIDAPLRNAEASRRFRLERQVLAALQHPHIVSLIDGGVTADGRAYLVMEHVEGVPVTTHCASRALPLRDRLRLFGDLCSAVQDAHQRAIVHRDLKPANILVTGEGVLKVLDFGIAKLLDAPQDGQHTMTGTINPLTPNYASPEQVRGLPVTTASDIYALGVVLYELVAGVRPYETAGRTLDEILDIVTAQDPPRPSARRDQPARLPYDSRHLRGDLDAIVLKAMSKDPARRYASARELADDIGRYLAGRPVLAREPSLGYVALAFARRHRAAMAAAAVVVLALITALGVSLRQTQIARAERARADQRFNDTRQLANVLLFEIHDAVRPLAGSTPVRQTIVTEALSYLERLSRDPATDDPLRLDLAKAYHRVGDVQGSPAEANLGDRAGALASYRKGIELIRPLTSSGRMARDAGLELASLQIATARIDTVTSARNEAIAAAREAVKVATALARDTPADEAVLLLQGRAHLELALAINVSAEESLPDLQSALRSFDALLTSQPDNRVRQRNVALVEKYLGAYYESREQVPDALEHFVRAQQLDERRLLADPSNRQAQLDVAIDLSNTGHAYWSNGKLADAAAAYERSLEIRQRLADSDPDDAYARSRLAFGHSRLGSLYSQLGRHADAVTHAQEGFRISQSQAGMDASHAELFTEDAVILGQVERRAGHTPAACQAFASALHTMTSLRAKAETAGSGVDVRLQRDMKRLQEGLAACAPGSVAASGGQQ